MYHNDALQSHYDEAAFQELFGNEDLSFWGRRNLGMHKAFSLLAEKDLTDSQRKVKKKEIEFQTKLML